MGKINILSSKIYNRISAGEVVERPASVVKELVENSIDAKATAITVSIIDGGITQIIVSDNGLGIEKSELKKAILPHATSKISKVSDLDCIMSLGFRGEALASIASVSKLTIKSNVESQELGAELYAEGGVIEKIFDSAISTGTEITVDNLFFNTPARAKFLKSEKGEESEITTLITRYILGNPYIAFKYVVDGKIKLQSFGDGVESSFVSIYGAEAFKDCFYIDTQKHGITIKGYIGKHYFTKPNRNYQTIFLNDRYIVNQTISSAISNAYSSYLMKRQYPFYSLSIGVPAEIVDVNVHPNKIDVRFANNQIIYGTIYSIISKVLDGSSEALNIVVPEKQNQQIEPSDIIKEYDTHNIGKSPSIKLNFNDSFNDKENTNDNVDIFKENKAFIEELERKKLNINKTSFIDNPIKVTNAQQEAIKIEKTLNYVGQALNTYLIYDDTENIYLIDQHAAHERILYDKLIKSVEENQVIVQPLLVPHLINLSPLEFDFISNQLDVLSSIGFDIAEFGQNTYKISGIPSFLANLNVNSFFNDILSEIDNLKKITAVSILKEKLAQKACKSAIKAGDKLSINETELLLKMLNNDLGLKCPHGRPICIKITKTEIEKWFKRIV